MHYPSTYRQGGGWILVAAAALGLIVAIAAYLVPGNGVDYTPGALLVVGSTFLILAAGLVVWIVEWGGAVLREILAWLILLGIVCTAFAAYLLEENLLVALMVVALVGWLLGKLAVDPSRPGAMTGKAVRT